MSENILKLRNPIIYVKIRHDNRILYLKKGGETMSIVHATDKNFKDEVLKAELPVLVDFFAEWCGPCKMVAPVVEEIAKEYKGKLKVVNVDVDNAGATASNLGIMSVPTLMIFKDGKVSSQSVGALSKSELKNKLREVLSE